MKLKGAQLPDAEVRQAALDEDVAEDRREVGRLFAPRGSLAADRAADGPHASTGVGTQLSVGADDVEAQGLEDPDALRPQEGELGAERRQHPSQLRRGMKPVVWAAIGADYETWRSKLTLIRV